MINNIFVLTLCLTIISTIICSLVLICNITLNYVSIRSNKKDYFACQCLECNCILHELDCVCVCV